MNKNIRMNEIDFERTSSFVMQLLHRLLPQLASASNFVNQSILGMHYREKQKFKTTGKCTVYCTELSRPAHAASGPGTETASGPASLVASCAKFKIQLCSKLGTSTLRITWSSGKVDSFSPGCHGRRREFEPESGQYFFYKILI